MSEGASRLHAIVHGVVQGVGFRYFVVDTCRELGLSGWVRNLPDGAVEAVAEGPHPALEELERRLAHGPRAARVTGVESCWPAATGEFRDFGVRHG